MKPISFMFIAGEASGDLLAAELVRALRPALAQVQALPTTDAQPLQTGLAPRFFGAGGPQLAAADVELAFDMTAHAVVGLVEVLKKLRQFKRLFDQLLRLAIERQPEAIICVDFSGFNRRFARAVKDYVRAHRGPFHNWNPRIIQYVSPQVWASRPGRARAMARDFDLLLSIFPFEKAWYGKRAPGLRVEFVGHPLIERYANAECGGRRAEARTPPIVLLLPGSRAGELDRHLPVMMEAGRLILKTVPRARFQMVLPGAELKNLAEEASALLPSVEIRVGGLAEALSHATLAIASTGTVTMECAFFGVPTVALYKTSWSTYQIGKRLIQVQYLAMPNVLADELIFPEFIQHAATAENIAREALGLLNDPLRREAIHARLAKVMESLGGPGASARAARAIVRLLDERRPEKARA